MVKKEKMCRKENCVRLNCNFRVKWLDLAK